MRKAVLDTNVLVSGLLKRRRGGIPDQILKRVERFQLVLAEEILAETYRVLHYPRIQKKYRLSEEEIQEYFAYLRSIATIVKDLPKLDVVSEDPDDNVILACALQAQVDYIVSGDPHLTNVSPYKGIKIISPAEFLKLLS